MSRLEPLFAPRGIAVVGASRDPGKLGAVMLRSLRSFGGPVAGINPRDADPDARRYASVAEAAAASETNLDLAVLCVPAAASARALADAARGGARAALVCSGGYAEAGGAGAGFQRDLAAAAAEAGVALLGPNTSGFLVPALRLTASFVAGAASIPASIPAGPVAVVAASGGVNHALAYLLAEAELGVSLAVGLGNAVDVSAPDVLRHLAEDDRTRGPLDEDQAKAVLGALGIATPPRRVCATREQAHAALAELPRPVAVKLLDARIVHKSDVGGVFLGVRDAAGLDQALDALEAAGHHRFLVESMAPPGVDLLAGASRDPVFGPVVLLGLGGVVAEVLADVAVALAPLSAAEAAGLADQLAGRALLDGFRGGPAADRAALGTVLARLGGWLADHPDVEEVEINPLRITHHGLVALDGVIRGGAR